MEAYPESAEGEPSSVTQSEVLRMQLQEVSLIMSFDDQTSVRTRLILIQTPSQHSLKVLMLRYNLHVRTNNNHSDYVETHLRVFWVEVVRLH